MSRVRIEVIFDTICPWCYVGKRRLERALAMRPHVAADLVLRPFLLNPDMPASGLPRSLYLERKFGSRPRVDRMLSAVAGAGTAEDIRFDFGAITRTPSTARSHRLIAYAAQTNQQWQTAEAVFAAYFTEGLDIGDPEVLVALGRRIGLPEDGLAEAIEGWPAANVQADNARAHRLGVNGVPCYIFEESYAVAGAQEPDVLVRLIDLAHETRAEMALSSL